MYFETFFFNDTATTEIYTLSLHDALPILEGRRACRSLGRECHPRTGCGEPRRPRLGRRPLCDQWRVGGLVGRRIPDRKSTRLNSSHANISYAVFCLKTKTCTS